MIEFKIKTKNGKEYSIIATKNESDSKIVKILYENTLIIPTAEILDLALGELRSITLESAY